MITALAKGLQENKLRFGAKTHIGASSLGGGLLMQPRANTTVIRWSISVYPNQGSGEPAVSSKGLGLKRIPPNI